MFSCRRAYPCLSQRLAQRARRRWLVEGARRLASEIDRVLCSWAWLSSRHSRQPEQVTTRHVAVGAKRGRSEAVGRIWSVESEVQLDDLPDAHAVVSDTAVSFLRVEI
jgi:hypothetical protein